MPVHGNQPNQVIHFDYLYMGRGTDNLKYVFVIRDDLSSYICLCPSEHANAESTANELSRWIRTFAAMSTRVSDQASHFKNMVLTKLAPDYNIRHSFTVAYSTWVNGTVEICMRPVLSACRALLSELKLSPHDRPCVVGIIITALNEALLSCLGKNSNGTTRSPLLVMRDLILARSQLFTTLGSSDEKQMSLSNVRTYQLLEIDTLQLPFENMHKQVEERVTKNRMKQIKSHNSKKTDTRFGDFVLVRKVEKKGHKLQFRWTGPRRVKGVLSDLVCDVAGIIDEKVETIHVPRLMLYLSSADGAKVSPELLKYIEHSEEKSEEIENL